MKPESANPFIDLLVLACTRFKCLIKTEKVFEVFIDLRITSFRYYRSTYTVRLNKLVLIS